MEGWFPFEHGEHVCLRIADGAERDPEFDDESQGALPSDPAARLRQPELTPHNATQFHPLPNAGVDTGRKTVPVTGEVSLDVLLHGRKNKLRFHRGPKYGVPNRRPVTLYYVNRKGPKAENEDLGQAAAQRVLFLTLGFGGARR